MPADTSAWQQTPTSTLMVRAKISPKVVGLMADPFWLARHPTNTKNRGLHRARVVMFSYFCKEVSPAAAELAGGAAQVVPELAPYFPPGDIHQTASQACYNCHSTLMPLANFFTAMDKNDDPPPFGATVATTTTSVRRRSTASAISRRTAPSSCPAATGLLTS